MSCCLPRLNPIHPQGNCCCADQTRSMCGVPDLSKCATQCNDEWSEGSSSPNTSGLVGDFEFCTSLLELAASDDLQGFKKIVEENNFEMHRTASWYCRQYTSKKMTLCKRTPAMIACLYGSLEVLKYILNSNNGGDINQSCGADGATALHCAAAGGCACVVDVVKLLLNYGADPSIKDAQGLRPVDVVMVSQKLPLVRSTLERLLTNSRDSSSMLSAGVYVDSDTGLPSSITDDLDDLLGLEAGAGDYDPPLSISPTSLSSSLGSSSSLFSSCSASSPKSLATCLKEFNESTEKGRGYPLDPCVPDIKNSVFTSDEFRMFSFKIRPCSRAYSHDWTECPFVHPGENARRRDPRRYHYSCVPCPDFRKGSCSRGDACEYAHGVFESWLHPAQYRTRLCKDGTSCARRVCFFAHTKEELRPLYVSTGSALSSPKALSSLDVTSMNAALGPASPSSMVMMSPFSPLHAPHTGLSTPPMSPSSVKSLAGSWSQPSIPTLHLPSATNQASRLRSSLNARDIFLDELSRQSDFEGQLMSEIASLSTQARLNAALAASVCGTPTSAKVTKYRNTNVAPTNLEDLFASEVVVSPRSPSHAIWQSQCNSHLQSPQSIRPCSQLQTEMHSTGQAFSPICTPRHINSCTTLMPGQVSSPFKLGSPNQTGTMESKALLKQVDVPLLVPTPQRENRKHLEPGVCMSDWGSPTGKPEWGVHGDDLSKLRNAVSFKAKVAEEPDLSWVQKLVRDGPLDNDSPQSGCSVDMTCNSRDVVDSVLGSWMEQVQLNEIVA